jgi:hypothetical protein
MDPMPKNVVALAAGVLIVSAGLGLYFGASRAIAAREGAEENAQTVAAVVPVASAKPILAPTLVLDEAEVRRLAREEAQSVLTRSEARRAAARDVEADSPDAEQLAPVAPAPTPPPSSGAKPAPAPASGAIPF